MNFRLSASLACAAALTFSCGRDLSANSESRSFKAYDDIEKDLSYAGEKDQVMSLLGVPNESLFNLYSDGYLKLWNTVQVRSQYVDDVDWYVNVINKNKERYKYIEAKTGVPWYFVGITHGLEASFDFTSHLHNGDPLTGRTYQVPAGRPKTGNPPFTWEFSAIDAMTYSGFDKWSNWQKIDVLAYAFETYNGFGYRSKGINSPYLWSFSNQYTRGKYVADGRYDPYAVSSQAGAMSILKRGLDRGVFSLGEANSTTADLVKATDKPELNKILRLGGADSKETLLLKLRLKAYGYNPGVLDSRYDQDLSNAVADFQYDLGLEVDGEVGPKTWAKLWPASSEATWLKGWAVNSGIDLRAMAGGRCLFKIQTKDAGQLVGFMNAAVGAATITFGGDASKAAAAGQLSGPCPDLGDSYDLKAGKTVYSAPASIALPGSPTSVTWHRVSGGSAGWTIASMNGSQLVEQMTSKLKQDVVARLVKHSGARNVLGATEP